MEQMYETLHHFGKEERSEYLGIIKEFGKMVKKKLEDSREKKDGLVREFDQILRDRGIAKKKLKLIENRVKYLEQYCGIDPKDAQQHTTQETLEF